MYQPLDGNGWILLRVDSLTLAVALPPCLQNTPPLDHRSYAGSTRAWIERLTVYRTATAFAVRMHTRSDAALVGRTAPACAPFQLIYRALF